MSKELFKLSIWFAINKLSLNVTKTKCMVFNNHTNTSNVTVCVNNFLGVLIGRKLKWKEHINMITSKLSKTIAITERNIF